MRFAIVAISVLLVWALPSAAARAGVPESAATATAVSKSAKKGQKKAALKKALRKCRKIRKAKRRKACVRKARKRFAHKPAKPKPGKTWRVDVLDDYINDYFSPDSLKIKAGDRIRWVWSDMNQNPHNISLLNAPAGVDRSDYATPNSPSRNYSWTRQLDKRGTWVFACSLHHLMRMAVKVGK